MALTFDCVSIAAGREPSGFAAITGDSPDGLRRRDKVDNLSYFEPFCRSSWPCGNDGIWTIAKRVAVPAVLIDVKVSWDFMLLHCNVKLGGKRGNRGGHTTFAF